MYNCTGMIDIEEQEVYLFWEKTGNTECRARAKRVKKIFSLAERKLLFACRLGPDM